MKGKNTILLGAAVLMILAVACDEEPRHYDPDAYACDAECEAQRQADREYMVENYPTREQMLSVHECVADRTGYEYPELPADFGPELLTKPRTPTSANRIEEDMPFRLVEKALVAVGQRKPLRERVQGAFYNCVYDLSLEDKFVLPRHQEDFRNFGA